MSGAMGAGEILRTLVAIPTPSAVSNLPLIRWVTEFLGARGWRVEVLSYLDEAGVEKANLIARPGTDGDGDFVDLAFICHTDTVPYAANWAGALALHERDGAMHGCGSCDVKGALASFLAAVSGMETGRIGQRVALILTADEEIGCKGMERLLALTRLRIGSAIVSEPTSLRAGIAGKGYGLARVTIRGREAHSAFPAMGVSAISIAARLVTRIEEEFGTGRAGSGEDPLFDPPRTTLNIGMIEGGTAKNIIPGRCSFLVEWRAIPADGNEEILIRLGRLVAEAREMAPLAVIEFEALRGEPGFQAAERGVLRARLAELLPGEATGISFGSEASRVGRIAREVIVIGPGEMRTAHSERECVPIAELEIWTETLRRLLTE